MSICSNCQSDNAFCWKCGQRLNDPPILPPVLAVESPVVATPKTMEQRELEYYKGRTSELNEENSKYRNFWEKAAQSVGLVHPPRKVDPAPERAYMRGNATWDDGYRDFGEEDVLNYLRSIGRIHGPKVEDIGSRRKKA